MRRASVRSLAMLALALAAGASAAAQTLPDRPAVQTLAGSGAAGITDGPGAQARFMGPQGIAYDARGDLIVADTPAQRIRMVDPHGNVTTIAGSGAPTLFGSGVAGGYRDGAALQAQFREPAGVAIGADGTIYVTDTGNHCIRAIAHGVVSTLAGDPAHPGSVDGPLATATFNAPRSIAIDAEGGLWITDAPAGVRRVLRGLVETAKQPLFAGATALAINGGVLYVATPEYIWLHDITAGKLVAGYALHLRSQYVAPAGLIEQQLMGPASAIAALGPSQFVYTDDLYSTVGIVQYRRIRFAGADALLDAGAYGGGFADGVHAQFAQPTGVAVSSDGRIAVADTANRRIRTLGAFDLAANDGTPVVPKAPDPSVYRIALVGNSYVWYGLSAQESVGGVIRARLCAHVPAGATCKLEIYPVRFDGTLFTDAASYVQQVLSDGLVNEVVLFATSLSVTGAGGDPARSPAAMGPSLRSIVTEAAASHTRVVVALFPDAFDLPDETLFGKLVNGPNLDPATTLATYRAMRAAATQPGVDMIDLWRPFFANDARPSYARLFGTFDDHFTQHGAALLGNAIAGDAIASGWRTR